jgi:hypothetical protein
MKKFCLTTTHLGESIEVFANEHQGYYFSCGDNFFRWTSHFDFASPLEALSICILHQQFDQIDRLEEPAAIFSIETGKILHTNKAHRRWLGHGCLQTKYETVLKRVLSSEEVTLKILPIASRTVGMYRILNAIQLYEFQHHPDNWEEIFECVTALNGFAHYAAKSQEILNRWVDLRASSEFVQRFISDLGTLDQLKGIA